MENGANVVQLASSGGGLASDLGLQQVEALMVRLAVGEGLEWTGGMVQEHLSSGGKRLRARLALAAAGALGGSREAAVPWAAASELLHNATLAHDDIQDGDWLRRGEPTLWVRYGLGQAINAGDLMLMLPTLALSELGTADGVRWQLARLLAARAAATVRGQSMEMSLLDHDQLDWGSYLAAVTGKTGQLLALPVEGAALLNGRSPEEAAELARAFIDLGVLFQLQDDLLDLSPEKGRVRGGDLREGKVTALVVAYLELHPQGSDWLLDLLRAPAAHTSDEAIEEAIRALATGGAFERVLERIEHLGHDVRMHPALQREPALHQLALELADWIAAKAVLVPGAP